MCIPLHAKRIVQLCSNLFSYLPQARSKLIFIFLCFSFKTFTHLSQMCFLFVSLIYIVSFLIPHCLLWCLWRERNSRCFEDIERSIPDLKLLFFRTFKGLVLCFAKSIIPFFYWFPRLLQFLYLISYPLFTPYALGCSFFYQYILLLIKKKNCFFPLSFSKKTFLSHWGFKLEPCYIWFWSNFQTYICIREIRGDFLLIDQLILVVNY